MSNNNLIIDEGLKEFTINGDKNRVIRFNPSDYSLLSRIDEVYKRLQTSEELKSTIEINNDGTPIEYLGKAAEAVNKANEFIKDCIDYLFDSKVSDIVFGNQSPLSSVKGVPFYERFLNAAIPAIKEAIEEEREKSKKHIEKYTKAVEK